MALQALISIRDGLGSSDDFHLFYQEHDPKEPERICHVVATACGRDYSNLFKALWKLDHLLTPISWPSKREYVEAYLSYHQHWYIHLQKTETGRKVTIQCFRYEDGRRIPVFLRVIEE